MQCDSCTSEKQHLHGAIVEGVYGQYCNECIDGIKRHPNAGAAGYARVKDREAHERDLLQPWDSKGNPNKEFIREFSEESHDIFTPEELAEFG